MNEGSFHLLLQIDTRSLYSSKSITYSLRMYFDFKIMDKLKCNNFDYRIPCDHHMLQ